MFDVGYDEIADAVDKSPAAVRQIALRAPAHVARAGHVGSFLGAKPDTRSMRSGGRAKRAICRACSTSSHRMSCSWVTVAEPHRPSCGPSSGPTRWPACWPPGWAGSPTRRRYGRHRSTATRR
ncbi:hypothetical protein [Micromonospora coerulea]|uniref:hypothetical protein n=1 Tax=Micromonospora coerulea TaxID=47856 RepID=UPI0031F9B758